MGVLRTARDELGGSLNPIRRVVSTSADIACSPMFSQTREILEPVGEMLAQIFGEDAVGVVEVRGVETLPGNFPLQLAMTFEVDP